MKEAQSVLVGRMPRPEKWRVGRQVNFMSLMEVFSFQSNSVICSGLKPQYSK
jgi:hypothetical protein